MKRTVCALSFCFASLVSAAACGGTTTSPSTNTNTAPPLAACSSWAATQRATGVPSASGSVVSQREALYAAGGGIRAVGSKYYAAWFPSGWGASSPRRVLVGLHGTGGAPETDWSIDWKDIVSAKGWAYVGLKYVNDATGSHDDETTIHANIKAMIDQITAACDFATPSMFLVGFSRGSAEAFPVAYLDLKDRRFFKAIGNNSGAWPITGSMTPTMEAIKARGETNAYSGSRFWMYCGRLDVEHGYPMCDEMKNARSVIASYGGTVERLYEDPTGGHGGLAKNADAWGSMFSYFEGLR